QVEKRQVGLNGSNSGKYDASVRGSIFQIPSERTPGVSTTYDASSRRNRLDEVVVWRPRPSADRTAPTTCRSSPSSAFTSDDLPRPLWPVNTVIRPESISPSS